MNKEEAPEDFSAAREDRNGQVTRDRRLPGLGSMRGSIFSEPDILANIIGANDAFAAKSGAEERGRTGVGKLDELPLLRARRGAELQGVPIFVHDIVEEGAKL